MTQRPADAPQPPRWRRQLDSVIETQISRSPFLVQSRAVLRQLRYERENWPLLIPLLLVIFVAVYRRERRKLLQLEENLEE